MKLKFYFMNSKPPVSEYPTWHRFFYTYTTTQNGKNNEPNVDDHQSDTQVLFCSPKHQATTGKKGKMRTQ